MFGPTFFFLPNIPVLYFLCVTVVALSIYRLTKKQEWLLQALGGLDAKVADNIQKQEFMEDLFTAKPLAGRSSFDVTVSKFASACFQNQRSWSSP